jgi:hypothetical protein
MYVLQTGESFLVLPLSLIMKSWRGTQAHGAGYGLGEVLDGVG